MATTKIKNVIATTETDGAGAATWWRAGSVTYADLVAGLTAAGVEEKFHPGKVSDDTAFKRSLIPAVHSGNRTDPLEVIPLSDANCYAVERKFVKGRDVHHVTVMKALLKEDGTIHTWEHLDESIPGKIQENFERLKGELDGADVGNWLASLVPMLNGLALRDRGGVYYVPPTAMATWDKIADVLGQISSSRLFELPAMECDKAVEAILDAIQREAEDAAQRMETELIEGDLSKTKLVNRTKKLDGILEKVQSYEALLGRRLESFHERTEALQAQMAAAILTASAPDADGV